MVFASTWDPRMRQDGATTGPWSSWIASFRFLNFRFDFASSWDLGCQNGAHRVRVNWGSPPPGEPRRCSDRLGSVLCSPCGLGVVFKASWAPLGAIFGPLLVPFSAFLGPIFASWMLFSVHVPMGLRRCLLVPLYGFRLVAFRLSICQCCTGTRALRTARCAIKSAARPLGRSRAC